MARLFDDRTGHNGEKGEHERQRQKPNSGVDRTCAKCSLEIERQEVCCSHKSEAVRTGNAKCGKGSPFFEDSQWDNRIFGYFPLNQEKDAKNHDTKNNKAYYRGGSPWILYTTKL